MPIKDSYIFFAEITMDRMSIASGSSGSLVSNQTVNEWRPLYKYLINNHPEAETDKSLIEANAKKQIKALKLIGNKKVFPTNR